MAEENNKGPEISNDAGNFFEKLQKASNEIDSIKTSFSKGMEDLAKIQNVLNWEGVTKFNSMIQEFEDRLTDAERQREEATKGARKYSEELDKEKERLVKLWDAYKNQEEELSTQEKKVLEFEEKLKDIEITRRQMEEDTTARVNSLTRKLEERDEEFKQLEKTKERMEEFDTIRNRLEETIHSMKGELNSKDETINSLESQIKEMKSMEDYKEYKTKYEEISDEYDKEKERLTKLFKLYEETELENKKLHEELNQWQNWFNSNEELFTKLFNSVDHLRKPMKTSSYETKHETTEPPVDKEDAKKKKRKIRFKK